MQRASHGEYRDPLDLVWLACAERLGMSVARSDEVYASWDGRSVLTVSTPEHFDPDDSLAQAILHEICHALVQGSAARRRIDWGLDNTDDDASALAEHACHRLQAALLSLHGLRALLAVTTDWRPYWDALPDDPLADGDDEAIALARAAWPDAMRGPWSAPLRDALRATAELADAVRPFAPAGSLWSQTIPRNPLGVALGTGGTCGDCAWNDLGRCRALAREGDPGPIIDSAWPACVRHEAPLRPDDCRSCGACCRQGFGCVGVEADEPIVAQHPEWIERADDALYLPRPGGLCVALSPERFTCAVYALRPTACRDFEVGGEHCLTARRRVGLSRA